MTKAREASATALKTSGWSLFVMIVLSAISAVLGGLLASHRNISRTMEYATDAMSVRRDQMVLEKQPAR